MIAGRRIVERHPEVGPLWWMCAHLLTSDDPTGRAWEIAEQIDTDPTPRQLAAALPDDATVLTIGWPEIGGAGLLLRGDVRVLCADSRFEASGFLQRLERCDVECEPVPPESIARAAAAADVVVVEAVAASVGRVLAPVGSHVIAAVARTVSAPVWLVAGVGRCLPGEYVDAIARRVVPVDVDGGWAVGGTVTSTIYRSTSSPTSSPTSASTRWAMDCDRLPVRSGAAPGEPVLTLPSGLATVVRVRHSGILLLMTAVLVACSGDREPVADLEQPDAAGEDASDEDVATSTSAPTDPTRTEWCAAARSVREATAAMNIIDPTDPGAVEGALTLMVERTGAAAPLAPDEIAADVAVSLDLLERLDDALADGRLRLPPRRPVRRDHRQRCRGGE